MSAWNGFPLSIFIIAKDEADRLPRTLAAIQNLSDDIVVIDSGSTDDTVEIAHSFGARVIINKPFPGYGVQKRFGEDQCRHDWILNIDADEVISPALYNEIKSHFSDRYPDCDGFRIKITDLLPGETNPRAFQYSLYPVRLYRRSRGRYNPSIVHDRVDMVKDANIRKLNHTIYHFPVRSFAEQIQKLIGYSSWQASNIRSNKRRIATWRIYTEFPFSVFKALIFRRYVLRGTNGYIFAVNYAFYRFIRLVKAYEKQK